VRRARTLAPRPAGRLHGCPRPVRSLSRQRWRARRRSAHRPRPRARASRTKERRRSRMARRSRSVPPFDVRGRSTVAHRIAALIALALALLLFSTAAEANEVRLVVAADDADAIVTVLKDLLARQKVELRASRADSIDARAIIERPATFERA